MENKFEKGKEIIKEKIDYSINTLFNNPKINVNGNKEITIENHKGILFFEKNEVRIDSSLGILSIKGDRFEISYIGECTITISGIFNSVSFERGKND